MSREPSFRPVTDEIDVDQHLNRQGVFDLAISDLAAEFFDGVADH
jgi:hypothetical protein